jgi:hypothetical protein
MAPSFDHPVSAVGRKYSAKLVFLGEKTATTKIERSERCWYLGCNHRDREHDRFIIEHQLQ